ncbi:MAG: exo-alpha-sialidase [Rhodothermales bacterium]|nr:exo-alpha-sialidase [Rhodothermales bacterium]
MKITSSRLRLLSLIAMALLFPPEGRAEVATHGDESPGRTVVILEVNRLTDGDGPWGSVWESHSTEEQVHVLNGDGEANQDGQPTILLHPHTRVPIVAWPRRTATGYDIVVSRFRNGSWDEPSVVAIGDGGTLDPYLIADPTTGEVHLFYRMGEGRPHIEHRSASDDATSWSGATVVSAPGEIAVRPSAAWHLGRLLVAYEVHVDALEGASRQIVVAEPDGATWINEIVASTAHNGRSDPQIHSDGTRIWVDWIDAPDALSWTCREDDGSWASLETEAFSGAEDREYHVRGRVKRAVRER